MDKNNPIGIFDSGIGGLLIAKEIKIQMPNEYFIYFGDTGNMPYGDKSKNFIIKNAIKIVSFLYEKKCKALVIACNSITSNALNIILEKFQKKILILNVIDPVIKNNIFLYSKRIGIIATPSTIRSNFYLNEIKKYYRHLDIIQLSIPLLAFFIEKNFPIKKIENYIINYLIHLKSISIDVLILACTHYLYIYDYIRDFFNGKVHLLNIQKIVALEIKKKLKENRLLLLIDKNKNYKNKVPIFYTSSFNRFFQKKIKILFGKNFYLKNENI
ncbi:glutamate racemase [Blattabacterium cuenoti]|uniref:glutamate racemase n=1 Tax=Blattabacterium cuenoti TaxID=1653831 RepID=UPI00163BD06D|nr:glutamate racemase [Blattabacterium cuenoti]